LAELRAELERKNNMIQKHNERLQHWQTMLSRGPSAPTMTGDQTAAAAGTSSAAAAQPVPMGIPQAGPAGIPTMPGVSQGPLAFLEQTTSNIGSLPRGMTGS